MRNVPNITAAQADQQWYHLPAPQQQRWRQYNAHMNNYEAISGMTPNVSYSPQLVPAHQPMVSSGSWFTASQPHKFITTRHLIIDMQVIQNHEIYFHHLKWCNNIHNFLLLIHLNQWFGYSQPAASVVIEDVTEEPKCFIATNS
jgi:hypothetical protein